MVYSTISGENMSNDDNQVGGKGQQLNIRVRRGQAAFWEEAATAAGMSLSAWMKSRLSSCAAAEIAAIDEKYGSQNAKAR